MKEEEKKITEHEALITAALQIIFRVGRPNSSLCYDIMKRPELILTLKEARLLDIILKERLHYLYCWLYKTEEANPYKSKAYKLEVELLNRAIDAIRGIPKAEE